MLHVPEDVKEEVLSSSLKKTESGAMQVTEYDRSGYSERAGTIDLPLAIYTEWYWQMDLHNLFRCSSSSASIPCTEEIREYASVFL